MTIRVWVVALSCLGALLGAPGRALGQTAMGEWKCSYCHQPMSGTHKPGCPQGGGGGGGGGGDGGRSIGTELGSAVGAAVEQWIEEREAAAQQRVWEAQQAAEAARRAAEEAARLRLELANRLRSDWDQRDGELSRDLQSIFESTRRPRAPRSPAPGPIGEPAPPPPPPPPLDPSVVDLSGTIAGSTPLPCLEAWSRGDVSDLDLAAGLGDGAVRLSEDAAMGGSTGLDRLLAQGRIRASETEAFVDSLRPQVPYHSPLERDMAKAVSVLDGSLEYRDLENSRQKSLFHYARLVEQGFNGVHARTLDEAMHGNAYLGNFGPDRGMPIVRDLAIQKLLDHPRSPTSDYAALHDAKGALGNYALSELGGLWARNPTWGPYDPVGWGAAVVEGHPWALRSTSRARESVGDLLTGKER